MKPKTRITRQGTIHYLECLCCGKDKTTRYQRQKQHCKSCAKLLVNEDNFSDKRECKVCKEVFPKTKEHFYLKDSKTGRLDRTCKKCDDSRKSKWNKDNIEKKRQHSRDHYENNRELVLEKQKIKRQESSHLREYHKDYYHKNLKDLPQYKLKRNVSRAVHHGLTRQQGSKHGESTFQHLPYTPVQLREHLEKQFDDNMSWDNYGSYWHLDHIHPQSLLPYDSFQHPNFIKCWSLNNLQPLEAKENIRKSNKIPIE